MKCTHNDRDAVDITVFALTTGDLSMGVVQDVTDVDSRAVSNGDTVDQASRALLTTALDRGSSQLRSAESESDERDETGREHLEIRDGVGK